MLRVVQQLCEKDLLMTQVKGTYDSDFFFEHGYFHLRPSNTHFLRNVEEATQTFHNLLKELSGGGLRTAFKNKDGKIRHWGVSNFDTDDMEELWGLDGDGCATNQILYNLSRRGPEHDLIPACRKRHIPIMAYSPIEQGRLLRHAALKDIASRQDATPAQIALAWLLRQDGTIVIPKSASIARVRENRHSASVQLSDADIAALDRAFPPPKGPRPLEIL